MRRGVAAMLSIAVLMFTAQALASGERAQWLAQDVADAASRPGLKAGDAALLLGGALAALPSDVVGLGARQFLYVETMLAFLEVDATGSFHVNYGQMPPMPKDEALTSRMAEVAETLRDAYSDLWRSSDVDPALRRRDWLNGASYFAHLATEARETSARPDLPEEIDALVNLGVIQRHLTGRENYLAKALALFAIQRQRANAIVEIDAAFASKADARTPQDMSLSGYLGGSAVEALAPVALAAAGAEAARDALTKKDALQTKAGIDVLAGALASMGAADSYLAATWPCSPALVEGRLWRGRAAALTAQFQQSFGGDDVEKNRTEADRNFRAAIAIALHASGGGDADFRDASRSYLAFLDDFGLDAKAARQSIAKATLIAPGAPTPAEWRDAVTCGE